MRGRHGWTATPFFSNPCLSPFLQIISKSMTGIVKSLDSALRANNLEKVATTMDQFERQFENLDVQSEFVEQAMNNQAVLSTPEEDVNTLMQAVADEHGLEMRMGLPQAGTKQAAAPVAEAPKDDLASRLAELKGSR